MEYIKNQNIYTFRKNYQSEEVLRHSLDLLAQKTFGISLESWYEKGYWNKKCMPYTLFLKEKAVASVLAIMFEIKIGGEIKKYIQLSTVMTDEEYRKQGLLNYLMDKVFEDWKMQCDGIYLYANDSVLEFYPRFGFVKEKEYEFYVDINGMENDIRKLDIENSEDYELFSNYCKTVNPYAKVDMSANYELVMFHAFMDMKDKIYYLEKYDVIAIIEQTEDMLICHDIYGDTKMPLTDVLSHIAAKECKKARLLFTPKDTIHSTSAVHNEVDTTLFVLAERDNLFEDNMVILPIAYHA